MGTLFEEVEMCREEILYSKERKEGGIDRKRTGMENR